MEPFYTHPWTLSENEAVELQQKLAAKVIKTDQLETVDFVAGVDVAYQKNGDQLVAAVAVLDVKTLDTVDVALAEDIVRFPYIPGLFSFRELPPVIKAFAKLSHPPHLVVCDGQGIAHPRRFGLACHLGVIFDIPAIGCAKTRLTGKADEPSAERGSTTALLDESEVIGSVLRTQSNIKPVYISVGHRISLATACRWILKLSPSFRLPETIRKADQEVRKVLGKD